MDDITATFTLRLTPEDLYTLLLRTLGRGEPVSPASVVAIAGASPPPPAPEPVPEERIEAVETVIAAALPPKPARRAKANGAKEPINAAPLAPPPPPPPEPAPLDEPAMRSLLSKVGAVHPLKVKAITDLLEAHGGARRLSECDPSTWPDIARAASLILSEYST
jgi:hypothetical protein